MGKTFKWGILGTGKIANKFALGLATLPRAELFAVGSRSQEKAESFARTHGAKHAFGSYEQVAAHPEVDVVYVATPHPFHLPGASLCLKQGKAVLCEKPLTVNLQQAEQLVGLAREQQLFLMEAMWTRFIPAIVELRKWIQAGRLGKIVKLQADFSFKAPFDPQKRTYNPELAGGALLDIGIYPIAFAYMIFGREPVHVSSFAQLAPTGVDQQAAYLFGYEGGEIASLQAAFTADFQKSAFVIGTSGMVELPLFWRAQQLIVHLPEQKPQVFDFPYPSTGLQFQAEEVMNCLDAGMLESDVMPLDESLRIMAMMDRLRKEWGLRYPFEQ
ncbi:MAG: gfo/Idh/MocA family oxidoreductase [Bacteroidetes bacterium]|nr:MAG: gfo/Idh/MocA family oxidoreductase [Bacteroidota bacterium]